MSDRALSLCLLTAQRDSFGIPLGIDDQRCSAPPFDSNVPRLQLWSWPWADWTSFNPAVLDMDRSRVERWYRARGFYDARVLEVKVDPAHALQSGAPPAGSCNPEVEECHVRVTFVVSEGEPLRVASAPVEGLSALTPSERRFVLGAALPAVGERFDEWHHDRAKRQLAERLAEVSFAGARVDGTVTLNHRHKLARIRYSVQPGPRYRFGRVRVQGHGGLAEDVILAAADIEHGAPYRQSALVEVQQEVTALGAFASVQVHRALQPEGAWAHLTIKATPLPRDALRFGVGVMSGTLQRAEGGNLESVPQWDVHLLASYERRHVLGGLGKLRIEERPRLIFQRPFPSATEPTPGNLVRLRLNQPGVLEARTDLIFSGQWDLGPAPFLGFHRSDIVLRVAAKRAFFGRVLSAVFGVQHDRFLVGAGAVTSDGSELPASYAYSFVDQQISLDFRDDDVQPSRGVYGSVLTAESVHMPGSDWTSLRVVPELRGYVPLPLSMVLAARFMVGAVFIEGSDPSLDATSRELGPNAYRLRGGGATSNRGFGPGELGVGSVGGLRRWDSSAELRMRLGRSFGIVGFFDVGDVNRGRTLRFDQPNPSAGFGLRYFTIVGALRFDVGFQLGAPGPGADDLLLFGAPGAMHLTLGEAY